MPPDDLALERVAELEDARDDWTALAAAAGDVFASWEWAATWWRRHGAGAELLALRCRRPDGETVGILPLQRARSRGLRVVSFLGRGPADRLGPVCHPRDRVAVARALRRALAPDGDWDVFLGDHLPGEHGWPGLLGATVLRRDETPVLPVGGRSWDELLASRSRNFREQVRRRERKLAREHPMRYRLADRAERLDEDLDALFALHRARWAEESGAQSEFTAWEPFHRDFAHVALERGWLRLWLLEVGDAPVAAWYGFRFGGAEWYYQAGRDPAWSPYSVGFVLLAHTVREALADGVSEYRFLRGGESYKGRFAELDPGVESVALTRGARGRAALAALRAGRALPAPARRLAETMLGRRGT